MKGVVLGGGISGLVASYRLKLPLWEATDRVGGVIRTTHHPFFFEHGPRTFQAGRSPALQQLVRELNLPLIKGRMGTRWLYNEGSFTNMLDVKRLYIGILKDLIAPRGPSDETIAEFGYRRFGKKLTETHLAALVRGIYAGDIHTLSITECFPQFKALEKRSRSLLLASLRKKKSDKGLFTLSGGMETLTQALATHVEYNRPVTRIQPLHDGVLVNEEKFDHVYCALPASTLRTLAWDDTSLTHFGNMTFESLTVVNVAFAKNLLPFEGFGYLTPKGNLMGVVFDSSIFPEQNTYPEETRLTLMLKTGGEKEALLALRAHLNITDPIDYIDIHTYANAIPNYTPGHRSRLPTHPHITFLGNHVDGVSLNACIQTAEAASQ